MRSSKMQLHEARSSIRHAESSALFWVHGRRNARGFSPALPANLPERSLCNVFRQMRLPAVAFDSHSKTLELQDERETV